MIYDITELLPLQAKLDAEIASRHGLTYASTSSRRLLALMVEVAELANATRTFKYWSVRGPEGRERILDEAADGLHFFLGIFLEKGVTARIFDVDPTLERDEDLTSLFLTVFDRLTAYRQAPEVGRLQEAFLAFLQCVCRLGFSNDDLASGYRAKLRVNYSRQEQNY